MPTMTSGKVIDNLPDELLLEIFSYFTTEELAMTIQHVSCRWKEVSQDNSLWENRAYSPGKAKTDEILHHISNMPMLKMFSPKRRINTNKIINELCNTCRNIQQLEFSSGQIIKLNTIKQIHGAFPDLTYLSVPLPIYENHLQFFTVLGQFKKLIILNFGATYHHVEAHEKVLSILADECPSLQQINLGRYQFDDEDLRYFLEKKRYQLLSFSVQCVISTLTHIALSECTNLEYLAYCCLTLHLPETYVDLFSKLTKMKNLSFCYFREGHIRNLPNMFANNAMPYLTTLNISWCQYLEPQTMDAILRNCPGLEELTIQDHKLNGGLESIGTCSKLEKLTLQCRLMREENFEYIGAGCHGLKFLVIKKSTHFTNKALKYICARCTQLEHLHISDAFGLTDAIFDNLIKCTKLRFLNITNNVNITGMHFDKIPTYLVHLETLIICWCEKFNKEILEKLKIKMPRLKADYVQIDSENEESSSDVDLEDVPFFN